MRYPTLKEYSRILASSQFLKHTVTFICIIHSKIIFSAAVNLKISHLIPLIHFSMYVRVILCNEVVLWCLHSSYVYTVLLQKAVGSRGQAPKMLVPSTAPWWRARSAIKCFHHLATLTFTDTTVSVAFSHVCEI